MPLISLSLRRAKWRHLKTSRWLKSVLSFKLRLSSLGTIDAAELVSLLEVGGRYGKLILHDVS